ncbi:MAG: hypothetical protein H6724_06220 [Sandaracinus sp.]|nr:hypothetical protein [Sandaracinus sp.]
MAQGAQDARDELASVAGEEARDLVRLLDARVPVARGRSAPLESRPEALAGLLREVLDEGFARVFVRVLAPSAAERRSLEVAGPGVLRGADDVEAFARAWSALRGRDAVLRIVGAGEEAAGGAASVDPQRGDPDILAVWAESTPDAAWRIDRRSTRVEVPGEGLGVILAERIADLVDRVQLELGAPVRIEWVMQEGRPCVLGVRPLSVEPSFVDGRWRRVALVAADEGTVAPLAVDTLDRALRSDDEPGEIAVRRIYSRPYRRREPLLARLGDGVRGDLSRASAEATRAGAKVAPFLGEAFRFERASTDAIASFDREPLTELPDEALLASLRDRQRYVAEGLAVLDHGRVATRVVLAALEVAVGPMRREQHAALASLRMPRTRRRFHEKLKSLAKDVEDAHGTAPPNEWSPALRRRFDELRASLGDLRPLGVDVAPRPYGFDDATLHRAMLHRPRPGPAARERAREEALERVIEAASGGLGGPLRVTIVRGLGLAAYRVARAKGGAAEVVSAGLLRVRRAASEVGARLVRGAVLDEPDDALYLSLTELEDAVRGEPGAYAARVRLRREDDLRWRSFAAPRRVGRG